MLKYWIWLATRKGLGCKGALQVLHFFGSPKRAYFADEAAYLQIEHLRSCAPLLDKSMAEPEKILQLCYQDNIHILTYQDAAYPERLKNIEDAPLVLYYQGTLPAFDAEPVIAMVGTRKASAYGLLQAKQLGYQLGRLGAIVISGGASGIDTLCLKGALTAGRPVAAVLGCGVDVTYPAENRSLFQDIRAHGCLLSEYAPGTPPLGEHFPVRNRILSGLALGVVVVEAPLKSGALITAEHALEQGRDVFTVPGNVTAPTCQGNIQLLKEGAIVVSEGWDVMQEYERLYPEIIRRAEKPLAMTLTDAERGAKPQKRTLKAAPKGEKDERLLASPAACVENRGGKGVDNAQNRNYIDVQELLEKVSADERAILQSLMSAEKHIDTIIDESGLPAGRILASMTLLEVKGYVKRLPGRMYGLAEQQ